MLQEEARTPEVVPSHQRWFQEGSHSPTLMVGTTALHPALAILPSSTVCKRFGSFGFFLHVPSLHSEAGGS